MDTYTIKSARIKPFKGEEGEMIQYAWYKAFRKSDGMTIEFGSSDVTHEEGEEYELDIEKRELASGKIGYREVVER